MPLQGEIRVRSLCALVLRVIPHEPQQKFCSTTRSAIQVDSCTQWRAFIPRSSLRLARFRRCCSKQKLHVLCLCFNLDPCMGRRKHSEGLECRQPAQTFRILEMPTKSMKEWSDRHSYRENACGLEVQSKLYEASPSSETSH